MSSGRLASILRERGDLLSRVILASVQAAAIAWFSPGRGLPLDDAWIHQVVGRTFAESGTLGYAPGQHGAAATSYLWGALLGLGFKLHLLEPSRWALALNAIAALAAGQLLYAVVLRGRPRDVEPITWKALAFASTLFAATSPNVLWFVCSGMEATPFVALSLAAIWAATDDAPRPRRALYAGLCAGALALLRPEAAPLGGLLAAHALVRRRARSVVAIGAPWLASVAIYVGSNVAKTGHALPSTLSGRRWLWFEVTSGLSRSDRALDFLDAWNTRLGTYTFDTSSAMVWILAAIAAYGALRIARGTSVRDGAVSEDAPRLLLTWALFHGAFYALLLPTPGHGGRYQPLTPILFAALLPIGSSLVLTALARAVRLGRWIGLRSCAVVGLVPWIALSLPVAGKLQYANNLAVAHIEGTEIAVGRFLDTLPEGTVASFDIGGSGYAARRRILDLGGLSDPDTAALLEAGRVSTWLEKQRVRWIVLPQSYESALPTFEDYRARLHLTGNAALSITPVRSFETPFDKWEPSIRATWNAAPKQVVYEVSYTSKPGPREVALVPPTERRPIADPASLIPPHERVVAEHMLATLAAWELPVDVAVSAAPSAPPAGAPCAIALGPWGFAVGGCASLGDAAVLRASAYEHAGRYLDVGDLGGALRAIPHVVAEARRRVDPRFLPPLASLTLPLPNGAWPPSTSASRWGLPLFLVVLLVAFAIERVARRAPERSPGGARVALLALVTLGACTDTDVTHAVARGRGAVAVAIANGGDADAGGRPLFAAASSGDAEIVAVLLAHGARVDAHDASGATALHLAARRGHAAVVAELATAMAPPSIDATAGPRRRTALHDAALAGSAEAVQALLRAGAAPNTADLFGQTALHLLAAVDPPRAAAAATALLDAGADPTIADARGFTALHAAAITDNVPLVKTLSARAGLAAAKTPGGETALDVAVRYGRDRAAEALLSAGMEWTRDDRWPPLHEAARMDALERALVLVASGADVKRRVNGKTALELATESGSKRVAALLGERAR